MIRVITALNRPEINEQLKKEKNINIIGKDICYSDGIFEALNSNLKIDLIIINYKLLIKENLKEFIKKINIKNKKVRIIIIYEKIDNQIIHYCSNYKNFRFYNEKINLKNIKKCIQYKENINNTKNKSKVITFSGSSGVGKSVLISIISKELSKNEKTLLIDLNINKPNLKVIFNKNKIENIIDKNIKINNIKHINNKTYIIKENKINMENYKIQINQNLDLIDWKRIYTVNNLKTFVSNYKFILIEISENNKNKINKKILKIAKNNIIILEPNILELYNFNIILNKYLNVFKIENKKIKIIINKINSESLDLEIINKLNKQIKIIYKIKYNKIYNKIIFNFLKSNEKISKKYKEIVKILKTI